MSYNTSLQTNNAEIQALIDIANALPDATDGVELPTLTTPAGEAEVFEGYEYIDQEGAAKVGTFTIEDELSGQGDLIAQIQSMVDNLPEAGSGGTPTLQDKTVTPTTSTQTITADDGYDGLSEVTVNAMPAAIQATPSISVSSSGLITASATQTAGYVAAGTKSATEQLTTKSAQTITPTTSEQVIVTAGTFVTGDIVVTAISNDSGSSGSGETGDNMVTVINSTGANMTIGLYDLKNGESVQLPCNITGAGIPICFVTKLSADTFLNSAASIMSSSTESVSVGIGNSGTSTTCQTGYLLLVGSRIGSTLEITLA